MRNIKMIIQYDGGRYKGWQKQNIKGTSVSTIQDKIEKVLEKMTGEEIQLVGCGRTDSGVHADNYIANFKTNSTMSIDEMKKYLLMYLPEDIVIKDIKQASERFHARLNIVSKTYVYTIDNNYYNLIDFDLICIIILFIMVRCRFHFLWLAHSYCIC